MYLSLTYSLDYFVKTSDLTQENDAQHYRYHYLLESLPVKCENQSNFESMVTRQCYIFHIQSTYVCVYCHYNHCFWGTNYV